MLSFYFPHLFIDHSVQKSMITFRLEQSCSILLNIYLNVLICTLMSGHNWGAVRCCYSKVCPVCHKMNIWSTMCSMHNVYFYLRPWIWNSYCHMLLCIHKYTYTSCIISSILIYVMDTFFQKLKSEFLRICLKVQNQFIRGMSQKFAE